jgi:hypothetical protein
MEDDSKTIGDCPYNSKWMRDIYPEYLEEFQGKNLICPEIIVGSYSEFKKLLIAMITESNTLLDKSYLVDMAILMKLFYTDKLPNCTAIPNEDSYVYTVGYVDPILVSRHNVVNRRHEIPAIVHQYDRHIKYV